MHDHDHDLAEGKILTTFLYLINAKCLPQQTGNQVHNWRWPPPLVFF